MNSVLQIEKLTRHFGDFTAVDGVDLEVEEGSFFSILGPSGCGKTTLLRMIAGFLEPTSGTVRIRGEDMAGIPPNRRPVNLVFQNLALFPTMNVAANIAFGLRRRRLPGADIRRRVASMLERVGLEGYGGKPIAQLSGGQKQRVAIARALVLEPSILLLDEPLGALDLKLREQMKIELKQLQAREGTTFIYITHDQSEALVMSDRVAVMNEGRFEQIDTPQGLYAGPVSRFVAGFVGENNILEADIEQQQDRTARVRVTGGPVMQTSLMQPVSGSRCKLYIRPESVMLEPDTGLEGINRFTLEIRSLLFDGSNTKVLAAIDGTGPELIVALPQTGQFIHVRAGDKIAAGVHPTACGCYPE